MKKFFAAVALIGLALCLAAPILYFLGILSEAGFKLALVPASLTWFVFGALWAAARNKRG